MEDPLPLINSHNLIDFPPPLQQHNNNYSDDDNIDLIKTYTSMKELILSSPPSTASPTNNSWQEIPIKDPLVQHAAWAYLQPMVEARDVDERWWRRLQRKLFSCFNDVVLVVFNGWFNDDICDEGYHNHKLVVD